MPNLTPKMVKGHTYYYARYCPRVNGEPKIVRQVYLGKIDDLVAAAERPNSRPNRSKSGWSLSAISPPCLISSNAFFSSGRVAVLPLRRTCARSSA